MEVLHCGRTGLSSRSPSGPRSAPISLGGSARAGQGNGLQIVVDDLGPAAALNMLAELQPHFMKVDMSIVRNVDKDEHKRRPWTLQFRRGDRLGGIAEGGDRGRGRRPGRRRRRSYRAICTRAQPNALRLIHSCANRDMSRRCPPSSPIPDLSRAARPTGADHRQFDGLHRGHRHLIARSPRPHMLSMRRPWCTPSTLRLGSSSRLTPRSGRDRHGQTRSQSRATGVDHIVVETFTREFAAHPPEWFLDVVVGQRIRPQAMVGYDFRFGGVAPAMSTHCVQPSRRFP